MNELPAGQVTVADLYRELVGMRADVTRALERISLIDQRNTNADTIRADHENRIRALESFRWKTTGIALSVSLVVGTASGVIASLIH